MNYKISDKYELKYTELYEKNYSFILRYCYANLNNTNDAEDCAQNVFLTLYKKIQRLENHPNINGWLIKTAQNYIKKIHHNRSKNKNIISIEDISHDKLIFDEDFDISLSESDILNLSDGILSNILEESELELLRIYYIEGKSLEFTSKHFNKSIPAIKSRIFRVKNKIKNYLK